MLNDLWELSPATGEWTWMGGSDTINSPGVYGTLGVAAATNVPAARFATTSWTDPSGNFWLFGGEGFDVSSQTDRRFNDFWELSPSTITATWWPAPAPSTQRGSTAPWGWRRSPMCRVLVQHQ